MTVSDLLRYGLVLSLLAFIVFIPAVGITQESQEPESAQRESEASENDAAQVAENASKVTEFTVSPNRCVTLRQGQPCFVRVRFEWQSSEVIKACMYGVEGEKIKCWQAANEGSALIAQTLPNTTDFVLVDEQGVELTRASVSVAWVYKKKRSKRRWRLF